MPLSSGHNNSDGKALLAFFRKATFLKSADVLTDLPPDSGVEAAFAGRSNAGKSSAINRIADHGGLARTSKTPGRTQTINLFSLDPQRRLVDLPGYGYAKVSAERRTHWETTLPAYLQSRASLRGIMLIMDIRHPLAEDDRQMLVWSHSIKRPIHVLLNKADKLNHGPAMTVLTRVQKAMEPLNPQSSVQLFSSLRGAGVDEARAKLAEWLEYVPEV